MVLTIGICLLLISLIPMILGFIKAIKSEGDIRMREEGMNLFLNGVFIMILLSVPFLAFGSIELFEF